MAEVVHNQPRALAPRKLEEQETLHTLNHWRGVFLHITEDVSSMVTSSSLMSNGTTIETEGLLRVK